MEHFTESTAAGKSLLIAGPCSAESETQMMQTAVGIASHYPGAFFRAGIWKPRTKPGFFEGLGDAGLPLMQQVRKQTGLKLITEVASAAHVESVLNIGIDAVWIGARTVVNPFSVTELAAALRGVDLPVFVKNPVHPDMQLWIGALQRIMQSVKGEVHAIHRGFHVYSNKKFRNQPLWEIPIQLMAEMPGIPILCDPSHIAGKPHLIRQVAQKALDLGMRGLMIEVHANPSSALSDATQQIQPQALHELLNELVVRRNTAEIPGAQPELAALRGVIDHLDQELIRLFADRMSASREIGEIKKRFNIPILQIDRWQWILKKALEEGTQLGLDEGFIRAVYQKIHEESIHLQSEVMNENVKPLKEIPG